MQFDVFPNSMRSARHTGAPGTRVAILTRTKNRPVTLARALVSVLSQVHADWHLYLVNDGGDPAVVERLVQGHETAFQGRVTLRHHPESLGMEAASNAALAMAEGDFIVVHDDDDTWHPDFLAATVSFLCSPENIAYAAVATNCTMIHERIESGVIIEEQRSDSPFWQSQIDSARLLSRNSMPVNTLLVRKSAVDAIGPFNAALPVLGDWDFNIRVLMVGDIATIDRPLAYYHWRSGEQGAYGNSVMAGSDRHTLYDVLYRNSLVRQLLLKEPSYLGLMQVLMRHTEDQTAQVLRQIDQNARAAHERFHELHRVLGGIEQTLRSVQQALENRPEMPSERTPAEAAMARHLWTRLLPLRRIVARLRGRIWAKPPKN